MSRVDYDQMAPSYEHGRAMPLNALEKWRAALAAYLPPATGLPVLDLGAGTGLFATALGTWFEVRVVGVEPEGADAVGRSVRAGHPITLERPHSVADKLVAKSTDALNVMLAARFVDEFVTVSDDDLERASYEYLDRLSLLVEPSGAAPLAAVRAGKIDPRGRKAVLVVSGGNATPALIARIIAERDTVATA